MLPWSATPFYKAILWLRDYIILVLTVFILGGWVVISYFFLARPIRQLNALTQAATQLAQPTEQPITLPEGMEDTAAQLNLPGNTPCAPPGWQRRRSSGKTIWWSIWPTI